MTKRRLKLAEVRKNNHEPCPFGLPIPFGCKHAGNAIKNMAKLDTLGKDASEEEKAMIAKANTKLLAWTLLRSQEAPTKCPYAGVIMEEQEAVECNVNDSAPGQNPTKPLMAAPFYSKMFSGVINGLYTYPVGFYSDYNVSRNLYMGTYSLQGAERLDLLKMAAEVVEEGRNIRITRNR